MKHGKNTTKDGARDRPATKGARSESPPPGSNLAPPLMFSEMLFILLYLVYVCFRLPTMVCFLVAALVLERLGCGTAIVCRGGALL